VPKEWYTTQEAAQYLRVLSRTIYKWCQEGRLPTYVLGERRTRRFRKVDLDKVPRLLEEARKDDAGFKEVDE
jgi:excisionase family DNA binding protein